MSSKTLRYVGTTIIKGDPNMHVYVVDEIPNGAHGALMITEKAYETMKASIAPPEVISLADEEPANTVPVVVERDFKQPPDACKWNATADGVEIGCPRCGHTYLLPTPPFEISGNGDVRPAYKCSRCPTHRYLQLQDWMVS